MSGERDSFMVKGVGCWCPGEMSLYAVRIMGHTPECTQARRGWEANYRHGSAIDQQRRIDAEVGRQLRESAAAVLAAEESSP